MDICPSLAELAGLPLTQGLEGTSFALLLNDPKYPRTKVAFSEYPRGGYQGTAMRNDRYRSWEWRDKSGQVVARELYDHVLDPKENQNVADKPEHAKLLGELGAQLRAGIKLRADWQPNRRAAYMTAEQIASGCYRMEIDD